MVSKAATARLTLSGFLIVLFGVVSVDAQPVDRSKTLDGFGESRRGDVPEDTVLLMTDATDKAIASGLGWLGRNQSSDGSYGSGAYRGNIAVTSLCGLAFMS